MKQQIAGKRVVITGAARGIGAATATELARRGARLSLVGLEPGLLKENVEALGDGHMWVEADVTDQAALDAAVAATVEQLGGIDVVIANAGVANYGSIRTADPDQFARTVGINLIGVYRTMSAAVPHLVESRGYALIVASIASFVPLPGAASYSASKAGVDSLAAALRLELAPFGVTVGSVHPSWIDTDLVRRSEADLPSFKKMRAEMPWPAKSTTSVEDCARALADAVEKRAPRTFVPKAGRLLAAVRAISFSPGLGRLLGERISADVAQMDVENQALGATWR